MLISNFWKLLRVTSRYRKMLENRPEDALVLLVETVETVKTVETLETVETVCTDHIANFAHTAHTARVARTALTGCTAHHGPCSIKVFHFCNNACECYHH